MDAVFVFEAVDGSDVGMVERREDARLALEPGPAIAVGGECLRQNLHGDVALQARVSCAIDLAHPTGADTLVEFVDTEATSGQLSIHKDEGGGIVP